MTPPSSAFIANFERFGRIFDLIQRDLPQFRYSYMDNEEFKELFATNVGAANRVYVEELLFRAHWAALASIFRNRRWMDGMDAALKSPNYFSFCAGLRGFLESAADSYEAMYAAMCAIAEHFAAFRCALLGEFSDAVFCCEPLENILIHFTHARRVPKAETAPQTHHAKTMQDYLTGFEERRERILRDLYAELCEVTHPAAITVHLFGQGDPQNPNTVRFIDPEDLPFIAYLLKRHDRAFVILFQKSFNAALLTLNVLNRFGDPRLYTPGADQIDFSKVSAFSEIEEKINTSEGRLSEILSAAKHK